MSGIMPTSKMGFGCMRLPLLDPNDQTSIDLPQFKQMVDVFMEAGNTYFDTAFVYHEGASETALGEALVARYPRDSFTVATKCLAWALPNKEAAYNCLDVSLERMGLDYVDYYLLHNVGGKRTAKFDEYDMWNFAVRLLPTSYSSTTAASPLLICVRLKTTRAMLLQLLRQARQQPNLLRLHSLLHLPLTQTAFLTRMLYSSTSSLARH